MGKSETGDRGFLASKQAKACRFTFENHVLLALDLH